MGLAGVKFGCPGTIGFGTRRVDDRSRVWMEQDQSSSSPYDNLDPAAKPLQSPESAVSIMDSLLGIAHCRGAIHAVPRPTGGQAG